MGKVAKERVVEGKEAGKAVGWGAGTEGATAEGTGEVKEVGREGAVEGKG